MLAYHFVGIGMENRSEIAAKDDSKEEDGRARNSEPYSTSRATTPHTEDDMDVYILDYEEDKEAESAEEDLLVDLLDDEDWSCNLGGVKEMFNPDCRNLPRAAVGITPLSADATSPAVPNSSRKQESPKRAILGKSVTVEAGQVPNLGLPGPAATTTSRERLAATEAELFARNLEAKKQEVMAALGG
jgi:hypothetical protein